MHASQPRQENHVACGRAGLDGCFVVRRNCGVCVVDVDVVVVAAAALVMIHRRLALVGGEGARSMDLVVSESDQRKGLDRQLRARGEEHGGEIGDFEA